MRLQHASYRAYFDTGDYAPILYNWELGVFSSPRIDNKWHDLIDHTLPHCGISTQHMRQMVEELTGRKVKRLVAW